MARLYPEDVFDNPIATEGRLSSQWGLPGEGPDEYYPQDTGYPGEIAGPNYLLDEDQAQVYQQASSHLFDFSDAFRGGYDSFGSALPFAGCDPRIQSCPPGTPIPGEGLDWSNLPQPSTPYGPALPPGFPPPDGSAYTGAPVTSTIRQGSRGPQVHAWQKFLNSQGFSVGEDSSFGPATARATREFQSSRGLGTDGVVGPATRAAMTQPALPSSQRTPIRTSSRSYPTTSTTTLPALDPHGGPPTPAENGFFTTRNIAIGLIGLSVVGTLAVVAFGGGGGEKNESGLAW